MASDDPTDRSEQESDENQRTDRQQRREQSGRTATEEQHGPGGPHSQQPPGRQPESGRQPGPESPTDHPRPTQDQQRRYQGRQPRTRPLEQERGDHPDRQRSPPMGSEQRQRDEMQRMGAQPQMGAQSPPPQVAGGQYQTGGAQSPAGTEMESQPSVSSAVDIIERDEELLVLVDTPGFEKENIEIEADEHSLILTAERDSEVDEDETVVQHERPTTIQRVVPLPAEVDIDEAEATYEDGVSSITLPKHEKEEGRHTIGFQ